MRAGGGWNHRGNLSDWVMFKDNHLARIGIAEAVRRARATWPARTVHVECDTLDKVAEALDAGADAILLDNMAPDEVRKAVALAGTTRRPTAARGERRHHARDGARLRRHRRRRRQHGPDHDQRAGARHRPRHLASPAVLLAIDVGNTQTVIGLFGDDEAASRAPAPSATCSTTGASPPTPTARATSSPSSIQEFLGFHGFSFDEDIDGVALCSSVPSITAAVREMTQRYFGFAALVVEPGVKTGMPILYENPKEVGPDRIADAVGAFDLYGGPTIVVDFGTATTLEAICADGRVPRRRHPPRRRDQPRGAVRAGGRAAQGRARRAPQRHRQEHDRVDPVRRPLRLRRPGRRHRRAGSPTSSARRPSSPPAAWLASSRRTPARSPSTSRGSRCTASASSSRRTSSERRSRTASRSTPRAADLAAEFADLEPGTETERRRHRRRPADAAPGAGQARLRHAAGRHRVASSCSHRRQSTPGVRRLLRPRASATGSASAAS